ncbi:hypothetical protein F5X68DRAFT_263995 [Plectosphaerella plurivora]|uniref:Uncharacterized protein n=1 Tax=Plectosphaerella plurivora TaxID=936078 RepID=A0A9P9A7D1_9PEZI|nr:hypothetical protein F5X68DRAFT_263995 [Plectosphaerella plurivora]
MKLFRRRTSQEAPPPDVPLQYTHVIQVFPDKSKKGIKVHDLTASITNPYPSDAFKQEALQLAEAVAETPPTWIIRRSQGRVRTLQSSAEEDAPALASWDPSHWEHGSNDFSFPADSPHSSHALSMTRRGVLRNEGFVKDSVEYVWKCDSVSRRTTTLYKNIGGRETVVAKYATPSVFSKTGGTMVVDSGEIDLIVAILTCAGMVLKLRQASNM